MCIRDSLICGDVGFGKTEIAIRAAFKAIQDNKQVAYLVPTTVLAQQHYKTFKQRFKDFPVRVEMLSRFRTKSNIDQNIRDLKKGYVDIVIGTHKMCIRDSNCSIGVGEYADSKLSQKIYNCELAVIGENSTIPSGVTLGKNVAVSGKTELSDYPDGKLSSGDYLSLIHISVQ